jgi:hypothetical protein
MIITVYKNALDIKNPHYVHVDVILERIRTCKIQLLIDAIRNESDEKLKREKKKQLPSIIFAGRFIERVDSAIQEHSGLCVLDFDHVANVGEKKAEIASNDFVYAIFVSPSGDGLKVLVRIPPSIENHRKHYKALLSKFPELDTTSINISRVCFESVDADIYINKQAVEFTEMMELAEATPVGGNLSNEVKTNYSKVQIAVQMIRNAADGEKHKVLLKASRLMGGYIASGYVDYHEAKRILESEIANKDIVDIKGAITTIEKGIKYGQSNPIEVHTDYQPVQIKSDGVVEADTVWEEMKRQFKDGKKRGETTYFPNFDTNFKWKEKELTLIAARPNAGKTEFALQLMLMRSVFDGWKWAVFSPENYPVDEFYDSLIHAYVGKTTDPYYKDAQMTFEEYEIGYNFVKKHFFYIYPEHHTMEEIDSNVLHLIETEGIHGVFIDPFNQLELDVSDRDDRFLSVFLRERKRFAQKHELRYIFSVHPKTMSKTKDGNYDPPDMYDIAGGAMWGNKVDNIIVLHRPYILTEPMNTTVEVIVRKIKKQKLVGVPGSTTWQFDRKSNRYYLDNYNPLEAIPNQPRYKKIPFKDVNANIESKKTEYDFPKEWN